MRPAPATDGRVHPADNTPDDHHKAPDRFTITNTSQSLPPGTSYNLDIALGSADYQFARIQIMGARQPFGSGWRECAEVFVTRDISEAVGHSNRESSFKRTYCATYSKVNGDSYLSHKIFDSITGVSNRYIALLDAVLTGSVLRLTFHNYFGGSATLWVKGVALCW